MEAEQSDDRPVAEGGELIEFRGSRGVVLRLRFAPDGEVYIGTYNSTGDDSKLYMLGFPEDARMTLARLLIGTPQDGMVN